MYIDSGYLVIATYNLKPVFLKLCTCFLPGLQEGGEGMGGGREGAGATSTSPKFDLFFSK